MILTMAEICDVLDTNAIADIPNMLVKALNEGDETKRKRAIEMMAVMRAFSFIWSGIPIGVSIHLETQGRIYTPIGKDSPDRSAYIEAEQGEDDGPAYVAGGNRKGTMVYFSTFSTSMSTSEEIARRWIVNGKGPLDAEKKA